MTIEQLREQAQAKLALAKKTASEAVETSKLKAIIDGNLADIIAKQELETINSNKLRDIQNVCANIVADTIVYDKKMGENKKWRPSKVFGLGPQISQVYEILTGIQYAAGVHKQLMLSVYDSLSEDLIERTIDAFGSPAYFSTNYAIIVEAKPFNFNELVECLALIEVALDVNINKSKLTEEALTLMFESAALRAQTAQANYEEALAVASIRVEG